MNRLISKQPYTYAKYAKAWNTRNADLSAYAQNLSGGGAAASGGAPVSGGMPSASIAGSRQIDPNPVSNTAPGDVSPIPDNLSGPQALQYLQQKNPGLGNRIAGIMAGQIPYPSATRKDTQPILNAISQIDPTFDATTWKARNQTAAAYAPGGKVGTQILSAATAINHLYDTALQAQTLPDHTFQWMNHASNATTGAGTPQGHNLQQYNRSVSLYAPEVTKFLSGPGGAGGGEGEINKHTASYNPDIGKTGILNTVVTDTKFITDKLDPLVSQYQDTMGKPLSLDGQGKTAGPATAKMAALRWWSDNQDQPIPRVAISPAQVKTFPKGTLFATPDGKIMKAR